MNPPTTDRPWRQRLKKALMVGLVLGAVSLGVFIWRMFVLVNDEIPTAYAGWAVWELIDTHLMERSNQWPRGIAELQAVVRVHQQRGRNVYWPVNDLTNRISVDWTVDIEALRASAKTNASHPLLVRRRDGRPINPVWGKDVEPNQKLGQILGLPVGFLRATN